MPPSFITTPRRPYRDLPTKLWLDIRTHPYIPTSDLELPSSTVPQDELALSLLPISKPSPYKDIADTPRGTYLIVFELFEMTLLDHPLMTEEMKLARDVEEWIISLTERRKKGIVESLDRKLGAIQQAYNECKQFNPLPSSSSVIGQDGPDEIFAATPVHRVKHQRQKIAERELIQKSILSRKALLEDMRVTRLLRDAEAQTDRLLEFRILQGWDRLKRIRESEGFTSTSLRVSILKIDTSAEEVGLIDRCIHKNAEGCYL